MERLALDGIADADARLGRPFPLPAVALPLARWVQVTALGDAGVEVELNLDDTRPGTPGRLALYAGTQPPPPHGLPPAAPAGRYAQHAAALEQAEPALRPVRELSWQHDGLHLRLTAQGPWELRELTAIADAMRR